ncbi:hypothetical protein F2Q68_00008007 [Brassica cretica]|uniref:Serine-threonine/tyrosine-protein kinase catalytic domain-containing protein n=1 Tax=Brassica cretica TaxID=69181 RepID=A0A8S9KN81_BRACR|nr:hypothetical protein F2Q68_00008007 [Brassica cretica]
MESTVAPLPHRRPHLPNRSFRSVLHHLCSSFESNSQISLATPDVLRELVTRTEIACEPGEVLTENPLILEPRSDGVSGEFRTENVETVSLENNLMLGDVFDGIDLQDASVCSQHKDFFDEFELIINGSGEFASESCVNLCEALDVSDYGDDDGMAKQAIDFFQSVPEKPSVADEVQVDSVEGDGKKSIRSEEEEVPKLVRVLETNGEEMGPVTSSQVLTDSILQMVEDDDEVEEGEISGDDEYAMTGHLLVKSDVYSYGVVLLELLTGRKPVDMSQPPGQENLVSWTRSFLTSREGLEAIIDKSLGQPEIPFDSIAKVAAIVSMCVQPEVSHRPFMGEVVQALKLVCNECDEAKELNSINSLSQDDRLGDDNGAGSSCGGEGSGRMARYPLLPSYDSEPDTERGLSVSEMFTGSGRLERVSNSGPLASGGSKRFWQKMRRLSTGSLSEHGSSSLMVRSGSR